MTEESAGRAAIRNSPRSADPYAIQPEGKHHPCRAGSRWSTDDGRVGEQLRFRLKAALRRRRSSTELNTLTKELARDGWSQSTTDDIMKEAELSRTDSGIKRFTVGHKVHMPVSVDDVLASEDAGPIHREHWRIRHREAVQCCTSRKAFSLCIRNGKLMLSEEIQEVR